MIIEQYEPNTEEIALVARVYSPGRGWSYFWRKRRAETGEGGAIREIPPSHLPAEEALLSTLVREGVGYRAAKRIVDVLVGSRVRERVVDALILDLQSTAGLAEEIRRCAFQVEAHERAMESLELSSLEALPHERCAAVSQWTAEVMS